MGTEQHRNEANRSRKILSLDHEARGKGSYSTTPDVRTPDPSEFFDSMEGESEVFRELRCDQSTLQACQLAGVNFNQFKSCFELGHLTGKRLPRFSFTKNANLLHDASLLLNNGQSRQAKQKSHAKLLERARLVIPLKAVLDENLPLFLEWFPKLVTTWKGGVIEKFSKLNSKIALLGREMKFHFHEAATALLRQTIPQTQSVLLRTWDGSNSDDYEYFPILYNRLRVSAIYAPRESLEYLTALSERIQPDQYWLLRSVKRALHLTGNHDYVRSWISELLELLSFDRLVPQASIKLAGYIGLYYVDKLAVEDWTNIARPVAIATPWSLKSTKTILREILNNISDGSCSDEYQNTINLCRLALYLKCHPEQDDIHRYFRKQIQMIVAGSKKIGFAQNAQSALSLVKEYAR